MPTPLEVDFDLGFAGIDLHVPLAMLTSKMPKLL